MNVTYKKRFLKELSKLPKQYSEQIEEFVFEILPNHNNLAEVGKIEKLTGYSDYYKVRFGNYRIGIKKDKDNLIIETVKHRKEIYKFYP